MKKVMTIILILFIVVVGLCPKPVLAQLSFEFGGGAHSPEDIHYSPSYGKSAYNVYGVLGVNLFRAGPLLFKATGEASFLWDRGETTFTQRELKLTLSQFGGGARVLLMIKPKWFVPYGEAGVIRGFLKEKYPPGFGGDVSCSDDGSYFGGGIKVPLSFCGFPKWSFDINIRKIKLDMEPFEETIELGGSSLRVGLQYHFNLPFLGTKK